MLQRLKKFILMLLYIRTIFKQFISEEFFMSKYLAFDLGASSGRAIIGTVESGKLSLQEVHRFKNGPVEKDGSLYWDYDALCNELVTGLGKALEAAGDLDGIAIDTWGVDYVLFDRDRRIVRQPYNYRDERTKKAEQAVRSIMSDSEIYALTGIQKMELNTIYQLYAHKMEHPEELENSVFLNIPDALAFHLGGDFTTEYTSASTTGLLDPVKRQWCWELIDRLELPRPIFPEIVNPCTCGGAVSVELQKKFNCRAIPIYKVGSHDTASAVAAVPAPESGNWAYLSAGTWALLGAEISAPYITDAGEDAHFTNEGGLEGNIRFLTNIMGSWLFQETRRIWNESGRELSFEDICQMAKSSEQCKYLIDPNCSNFVTPGDMPQRIRDFCKATAQADDITDAEVARAIYDSLALYFRKKLAFLEELLNVKYTAFNIVGGGTKDRLLMQLTADALGIPVISGPVEATSTGNIIAQAIASGEIASQAAGRKVVSDSLEVVTYLPDAASHAKFAAASERFDALVK